jgi:Cu(I)/Ag(I) efflux system membrane fusion protein
MKISINKKEAIMIVIAIVTGLLLGWLFFHGHGKQAAKADKEVTVLAHEQEKVTVWTCSMHPQIREDGPGKCSICGMDLIPLYQYNESIQPIAPGEIQLTQEAVKLANIRTMIVKKGYPDREVFLLGKVSPDERNIAELTARFGGRIEKLYVNFTGQYVSKGERLATIYSPALVTAQKELLEALEYRESNPEFYNAARNKLKLWDLTDEQINSIENNGEVLTYFDVLSPISGTVTQRYIASGDYVKEGSALLRVIDLTSIWVMFEAYESDLPLVKTGDKVNLTIQSLPGKSFRSRVSFIDPVIDQKTRIARVRIEMPNQDLILKPGMFASGSITSSIAGNKKDLVIPKTAVLWTGKRAVVYVKVPGREQPVFGYREVVLGPSAGDSYIVSSGLREGEEIAVNGVFKIDAAAQLSGKKSMMNPQGSISSSSSGSHNHGRTEMKSRQDPKEYHSAGKDTHTIFKEPGTGSRFKKQLSNVYNAYIQLKDAFVASDAGKAGQAAGLLEKRLKTVDMELLQGDMHMKWMQYLEQLHNNLKKITGTPDIEIQRKAFADYNLAFYSVIKDFGLSGGTVYYQYCPMAVGDKGAYWFSSLKEIKNPYFGEAMLKCGETREILEY